MTDVYAIKTMNITVGAPEAGWSGIRFGKEAFIPLSYVQNIPEDIIDAVERTRSNNQHRFGCLCNSAKKELLTNKKPCGHNCAYCYWRDK